MLQATKEDDINLVDTNLMHDFIAEHDGEIPFALLVTADTDPHIAEALYAGAVSYINIAKGPECLIAGVRQYVINKAEGPGRLIKQFLHDRLQPAEQSPEAPVPLTNREREILRMMREGNYLKQIARETDTSYETVRTHVKRIYKKLGVVSASEAIIRAMKLRL